MFQSRRPDIKINFENGKPKIDVKVILEGNIYTVQSGFEYEQPQNAKVLEDAYVQFIKTGIERYLDRTAKEFESDICGFGEKMKRKFLTWGEWESFGWPDRYKDSTFNVTVEFKIRRTGLSVRTMPVK